MRIAWWTLMLGVAACAPAASDKSTVDDTDRVDTDVADTDVTVPADVTWHRDVRPIAEQACMGCHEAGGIGSFTMTLEGDDWATDAPGWSRGAVAAVASRVMPPWHASEDCQPIAGVRALSDHDVAVWEAWRDNAYAVGDPADFEARQVTTTPPLGTPDLLLKGDAPYTPSTLVPDDYHCLPLGDPLDADTLIRAIEVRPDQRDMVHHVILYQVNPDKVAEVQARDEAESGPGYTCFGGPLTSDAGISGSTFQNLHTWVPGNQPEVLPDGDARRIPAGSQLVMQVHYNTLAVPSGGQPEADETEVAMWVYDGQVLGVIQTIPLANYDIVLEAGDAHSVHTKTFAFGTPALVVGVMPHMHYLGSAISVDVVAGGGQSDCLVDVPEWDFNWQQTYAFPVSQPFLLAARDSVKLTCTYDNSAANQPVVNGSQQDPRRVTWGEGTLDEMCLVYANVRFSGDAGGVAGCGPFQSCFTICPEGDGECVATCLAGSINDCTVCGLQEVASCGADQCSSEGLLLLDCLDTCEDGQLSCLVGACRTQTETYLSCQDPYIRDGSCDTYLNSCGIDF